MVDYFEDFPFNLNSAVDELLKNEFDGYREKKQPHPYMSEINKNHHHKTNNCSYACKTVDQDKILKRGECNSTRNDCTQKKDAGEITDFVHRSFKCHSACVFHC